jgi:hypothetical protein
VVEKTKSCGLTWTHLGGNQFSTTETDTSVSPNVVWTMYLTKTQIGNATYKYTLDIRKASTSYITISDGPLPHTSRESVVKELYEIVEIIVLEMDLKLKETIRFIQQLPDCKT